eukprot:ANDGO_04385.mRNA.1 hypothetical protein
MRISVSLFFEFYTCCTFFVDCPSAGFTMESLSHAFSLDIPLWPGDPVVAFPIISSHERDGYFLRQLCIGEHTGTHLNAPLCFRRDGIDVETLIHKRSVLSTFFSCWILDVSACCTAPDTLIEWRHLSDSVLDASVFKDCLVFFYTGWSEKYWTRGTAAYIGSGFPGISRSLAEHLAAHHILGIGIDTHGTDGSANPSLSVNTYLADQEMLSIECLKLEKTHCSFRSPATVVLAPIVLRGGSGCPLQVLKIPSTMTHCSAETTCT